VYGDYRGPYSNGLSCSVIGSTALWNCYNRYYYDDCCVTCLQLRNLSAPGKLRYLFITRRTLVWKGGVLVAVFSVSGYRYLGDGDTDRPEWWYISIPDWSFSLLGLVPQVIPKSEILGLNFRYLTANISKTVSRSVTCQLELNISSTRAFKKCKSQGGSPPPGGVHPRMDGLCLADALVIAQTRITINSITFSYAPAAWKNLPPELKSASAPPLTKLHPCTLCSKMRVIQLECNKIRVARLSMNSE